MESQIRDRKSYLHRTIVDLDTVQLLRGLGGASWLHEDNGGGTTAAAVGSVGKHDLLHSSDRFAEVVLNEISMSVQFY
jgi:hypothetical protein